jgi:hypothetical protein
MRELWQAYELWVQASEEQDGWVTFTTPTWATFLTDGSSQQISISRITSVFYGTDFRGQYVRTRG